MKRTGEEPTETKKKRVRFDPRVKKGEEDDDPETVARRTAIAAAKADNEGLDILGRKRDVKAGPSSTADDENVELADKKHTLDSDEEEDNKKEPKKLNIRSLQGQEKATIEYDGSVKIMPFNMNEEMEEGYYDEEGNFVFNKEKDEIHDQWLDNLDWDSVKQKAGGHWNKMDDEGDADSEPAKIDGVGACERVLTYLTTDNMTVNDVLKKLNSQKNLTAAEERKRRWEAKKKGIEYKNEQSEAANDLTGAIDDLITLGHMEAYTMNRQQISELYEELEIEKERTERAERMKRLAAEEEAKKEAELKSETSAASLINDLMSDEEDEEEKMETENEIDGVVSEIVSKTES